MNGLFVELSEDISDYEYFDDYICDVKLDNNESNLVFLEKHLDYLLKKELLDIHTLDLFLAAYNYETLNLAGHLIYVPENHKLYTELRKEVVSL